MMLRVAPFLFALLASGVRSQIPICQIQGTGSASAYTGQAVTTTGIVTAVYSGTGTLQGFFIEDPGCDADEGSSNGLFVYAPNTTGIAVGDRVSVSAVVQEFQTLTELYAVSDISVIGSGVVPPTDILLPVGSTNDWERYEGMLLHFPQTLVVTDNNNWAEYGEITLSPGRLWQPTDVNDPNDTDPDGTTSMGNSNVAVIDGAAALNIRNAILLDDARTGSWPDPPPLLGPEGTLRCGSSMEGLTAVLHRMYGEYRLQPVGPVPLVHDLRPALPEVGGNIRVAAYNVHNYFSTLGGFGAANAGELQRQRTKLIAALYGMDADAYVLCEVQDNDVAWVQLLDALNAMYGDMEYAGIEQDESFGTKSVIFYRSSTLTPQGPLYWIYTSTFERAHITQAFEVNANGARFLLSSVHLHSKLCDNAGGPDLDQGDGQGCFNAHRRDQTAELSDHWASVRASSGIEAQLVVGDFNAYAQEDPLDLLRANGLASIVPDDGAPYSYRYGGVFGALDHAFATTAMHEAISGAAPWAINTDEPPVLDYPDENMAFFQANAFRSSDHDPLVVGIDAHALVVGVPELDRGIDVHFTMDAATGTAHWESARPIQRVEILDLLGRPVRYLAAGNGTRQVMDVSALSGGAYTWRCVMNDGLMASGPMVVP